jgi:hypothetical protein
MTNNRLAVNKHLVESLRSVIKKIIKEELSGNSFYKDAHNLDSLRKELDEFKNTLTFDFKKDNIDYQYIFSSDRRKAKVFAHFPNDSYKVSDWVTIEPVFREDRNGEDEVSYLAIPFNGIEIPLYDDDDHFFLYR